MVLKTIVVCSEQPLGEGGERIFKWSFSGDTDHELLSGTMTFKVSPVSAELLREVHATLGALVTGRRTFDIANGWGGRHPVNVPVFVATHPVPQEWVYEGSPFTFVAVRRLRPARRSSGSGTTAPPEPGQMADHGAAA